MDARLRTLSGDALTSCEVTPPAATLVMATQTLCGDHRPRAPRSGMWRLSLIGAAAIVIAALAVYLANFIFIDGDYPAVRFIALAFIALNMFWVGSAAATAVAGALVLTRRSSQPAPTPGSIGRARVALLYPIFNEDFHQVLANAREGYAGLGADGDDFEVFFLSDSNDAAIAAAESLAFQHLRAAHPHLRFFYRRRPQNTGKKAGNIADFVQRWGARYDYMVVFDADSTITPDALRTLVTRMQQRPRTAIIQTVPRIVGAQTVFARMQQFALNMYGPIFGNGLAWWSGQSGNYWGHNAIVRVSAFAAAAGLPKLTGRRPFGGDILSHDFVEAALLRRAGWSIEIAADIEGSYEQTPPTLIESAARDRRWAQGNLQHLAIIAAPGLDWRSRAHIAAGILGYCSGFLWLGLFVIGLCSARLMDIRHDTIAESAAFALCTLTALIVFAPKWLALLLWCAGKLPGSRRDVGFLAALALETIAAALITPILIVNQSLAVVEILAGRDIGWTAQLRNATRRTLHDHLRAFKPHASAAVAILVGSALASPAAAIAAAPVIAALMGSGVISFGLALIPPDDQARTDVVDVARAEAA